MRSSPFSNARDHHATLFQPELLALFRRDAQAAGFDILTICLSCPIRSSGRMSLCVIWIYANSRNWQYSLCAIQG